MAGGKVKSVIIVLHKGQQIGRYPKLQTALDYVDTELRLHAHLNKGDYTFRPVPRQATQ